MNRDFDRHTNSDTHPVEILLAGTRNVWANKFKFLFICLLIAGGAYYGSGYLPKKYASSLTLSIEGELGGTSQWDDKTSATPSLDKSFLHTQYELMTSRDMAENLAARYENINCHQPDPNLPVNTQASRVQEIMRAVEITPVNNTTLFRIAALCDSPQAAKRLVEIYAEEFINFKQGFYRSETARASDWVDSQMTTLQVNLTRAEQALQEFKEQESIYSSQVDNAVGNIEVESLLSAYSTEQKRVAELKAIDQQIRNLGDDFQMDKLSSIARIRDDKFVGDLMLQLSQVTASYNELRERYMDDYPDVQNERIRYNELLRQLRVQVNSVASGVAQELKLARDTLANIETDLARTKAKTIVDDRKRAALAQLENNVEINRDLYLAFVGKAGELTHNKAFFDNKIKIVNRAYEASSPASPNQIKFGVFGFGAAFLLFGAYWFARGTFDGTLKVPTEVELNLSAALLGYLPAVKGNKNGELLYSGHNEDNNSAFSEGIRSIRTSLALLNLGEKNTVTLITSSTQSEGKSTLALNLASAFGKLERTLLIDADVRRPVLWKAHGISETAPGLIDILSGARDIRSCISTGLGSSYDFIPAGRFGAKLYNKNPGLQSPLELLSSDKFLMLLERLKGHYDRIIVDSAPVCGVSDAKMIARGASQVVYVVAAFQTDRRLVKQGLRELQSANAKVAGVVLNKVDLRRIQHYGYSTYGNGYGNVVTPEHVPPASRIE